MKKEKVLKRNAIKAYKAFNSDLTCRDLQYEVGKEYRYKGELDMCRSGFHACTKLSDCFHFYSFNKTETRVAEVLLWGDIIRSDENQKVCASNIRIVRELSWQEVLDFCNKGVGNSGLSNSGDHNIGNHNSGNHNSGDHNSGDHNSGDHNSGNHNSGNHNSGNHNSGDHNSGDHNSGIFNTYKQEYSFAFNKPALKSDLSRVYDVHFLQFRLTEFIPASQMSKREKKKHPEYDTIGGYIKVYGYKEAFRKSFENAKTRSDWPEQLKKLKTLPNFDAKIFEEISGIKEEELV